MVSSGEESRVEEPSEEPGLRERKKAETREAIYDAAIALFRDQGYDGVSMDQIAARAGVSRATVFNYYGTKRSLLEEYRRRLDAELRTMEARLRDPGPEGGGVRDAVESFFAALAVRAESEGAVYRSLVREVLTQPTEADDGERRARRVAGALAAALERGRTTGELRPNLDPDLAAYTLLRLWSSALVEWAGAEGSTPLEARVRDMTELLFRGLEG